MTAAAFLALVLLAMPAAAAQDLTAAASTAAPPDELAPGIRQALGDTDGASVAMGETTLDFWWARGVVVRGAGEADWSMVPDGALVGAMRVAGPFKEVRGRTIAPGVYTLRFGLQPQNGDHLGVSPYREFLMLSPAAIDAEAPPVGYDRSVELSKEAIGMSHPAILSIDPPRASAAPLSRFTSPDGHEGVVFTVPAARDGQPAGAFTFGLILAGTIVH